MAKTTLLVVMTFLFTLLAGNVLAEVKKVEGADATVQNLHSAKDFIGTEVRDNAGKKVGEIKDVAIDFNRGIGYAVVSSDKALQIDKTFLVPLSAMTSTHEGKYVTLTVSRDQLATMPHRDATMTEQEYDRNLHDFYGLSYPWENLPGDVPVDRSTIPGRNLTYPGQREVGPTDQRMPGDIERTR